MLQNDEKSDFIEPKPCKYCKIGKPIIYEVPGDLCYAKCSNPECQKWDPYEFCASSIKKALLNWNRGNVPQPNIKKAKEPKDE